MKVWLEGRVWDGEQARIPVTDHGLLYGDGVFEGLRMCARRVFRLEDHLRRIQVSARLIDLTLPGGCEALRDVVLETARACPGPDAYLRLVVTRGSGTLGVDPTTCPAPRVFCIADQVRVYPAETLARGLRLVTASVRRPPADVLDPRAKTLNYLNTVMAKGEARRQGADDALVLNAGGHVAEAAVANVFALRGNRLLTPPATDGALEGITRSAVIELAPGHGLEVRERTLGRIDLFAADEVFLSGTGVGIAPVAQLDGRPIGEGKPGPVSARIATAHAELQRSSGTPVDPG